MREQALRAPVGAPQSERALQVWLAQVDDPHSIAGMRVATLLSDQLGAWEKFYGFSRRPFSLTPDLRFAFNSRSHAQAKQQVTQALKRREGLIVVTGDIGTGKTMLCRSLLDAFEARTFLCVILDPRLTVDELLRQVLTDFGLLSRSAAAAVPAAASRHQLVSTLQQFLGSLVSLNAHAVVMIDEAQELQPDVLEQIRLLSNFETDEAKLLQIVLVGQPNLDALLQRDDMRQLNQRVARRCDLHPLSPEEVRDYIITRVAVASEPPPGIAFISNDVTGPARPPVEFDPGAFAEIAALSRGIPRVVNTICDRVLEIGHQRQARTLDAAIVTAAAAQLKLTPPPAIVDAPAAVIADTPAVDAPPASAPRTFNPRIAIAAVLVVAAAAAWLGLVRGSHQSAQTNAAPAVAATPAPATAGDARPSTPAASAEPTPAVPTAAAPAAITASGETFHITVAAFRTEQRAAAVATALKERGLPAYTRFDPVSEWRLVIAGPFKSTDDAAAAQRTLAAEGFADTRVASDSQ